VAAETGKTLVLLSPRATELDRAREEGESGLVWQNPTVPSPTEVEGGEKWKVGK